ncbi:MAG: O-antigen ligase family protein [Candidatus Sumerlaeia bacterium]|nr:O-antigen ligase family protein [Candidatus Sumerlaeia bacterium]
MITKFPTASLLLRPPMLAALWLALLSLLFLLPIVVVPPAVDSFVLAKRTLLQAGAFILLGLLAATAFHGREARVLLQPINGLLVLLLLWMVVSLLWSSARTMTLEAIWYFAGILGVVLVYQSITEGKRTRLLRVAQVLMLSSLIVALWTLAWDIRAGFFSESFAIRRVLGDWRDFLSVVAFGNTSHIGDFLVFGFLLWVGAFILARHRVAVALSIGALWVHAAALIVCWSVHSNLSLVLSAALAGWLIWRQLGGSMILRRRGRWLVLVAGWILVTLFYVVDHPANPHGSSQWAPAVTAEYEQYGLPVPEGGFSGGIFSQAFASPRWVAGWNTRVAIWLTTLEVVRNNTWLGTGAGTFTHVYPATISELVLNNPELRGYSGSWTNAAHNDLLEYWSELGVPGAFLLVLLVAVSIKQHWDRLQRGTGPGNTVVLSLSMAALVALCLQGQMNFPLQLPVSSLLFFLLLGTPFLLPAGGYETRDLNVPVARLYGPVSLGIQMKNMAYPTEVSLRWAGENRSVATGLSAVCIVIMLVPAWMSLQPLRADMMYREMRELKLMAEARGMTASRADAIFEGSERLLSIWPGHVDCRSAYQDALLEVGRYEDVVEQAAIVLEKLNAIEVYERRALALEALGRGDEAIADWNEIFRRRPDMSQRHPAQHNAWLGRIMEAD